jgi:hypothetical protein
MYTNMLNISEWEWWLAILFIFLVARELVWKAIALYKAWQRSEKARFICIFIFNTWGILPIIYLLLNKK